MNKLKQYMEEGKTFVNAKELPTFKKVLKEQNASYSVVEMHANRFLVEKDIPEAEEQ
ncbi:hypothetical protein [Bacillus thuringiensis]|uniref:hypothetical protein n=1 Tax=Bacillus thuringiensis TaxID=1428 RepID=UPI00159B9441|nr:hypothetical protein [Bacillus thuringiensis]